MNPLKIRPVGNRLLVEVLKAQEKKGEILLPETANNYSPLTCLVVAVGASDKVECAVGNVVIINKLIGSDITTDDKSKQHKIINSEDVLCIVGK